MKDAVVDHYGSVKEAAYALDQVDPSQMVREFSDGKCGRLDRAEDEDAVKATVADALYEHYGHVDIKRRLLRELRELRAKTEVIAEMVERLAS